MDPLNRGHWLLDSGGLGHGEPRQEVGRRNIVRLGHFPLPPRMESPWAGCLPSMTRDWSLEKQSRPTAVLCPSGMGERTPDWH